VVFYLAAMAIMTQDYCLIYRFTVIWNRRIHDLFMTLPSKIGFSLAGVSNGRFQIIAI
jgi:hypothetical protein